MVYRTDIWRRNIGKAQFAYQIARNHHLSIEPNFISRGPACVIDLNVRSGCFLVGDHWIVPYVQISPQLAKFGIFGDNKLLISNRALPSASGGGSGEGRSNRSPYRRMIVPMALLIVGAGGLIWSLYHLILFKTKIARAAIILVFSWIAVALGTFLILAENADVSFVSGASATRYGDTKDVRVHPGCCSGTETPQRTAAYISR